MQSPTTSWLDLGSPDSASDATSVVHSASSKRVSSPAGPGQRLPIITEGQLGMDAAPGSALTSDDVVPPLPHKSHFRKLSAVSSRGSMKGSTTTKSVVTRPSGESLPPAYAQYNYSPNPPVIYEGTEKAEQLWANHRIAKRGGWGRLLILLVVVVIIAIALGVGLGVGLTRHKKSSSADAAAGSGAPSSPADLGFPIGEYSLNTALRSVQTNCTSNSATWRCYPYATYSPSSASASLTTFNWILANTSDAYISNATLPTTSSAGTPANISISSSDNPFSISFTNHSLTYLNDDGRPRYEFNYTMSQQTIPTTALTSDNSATTCFYNNTMLTGVLYLSDAMDIDYPSANSTSGSYEDWPFAVRVEQVANGGADVPACYKTEDGLVGERITDGFVTEAESEECVCDYRNFEL